MIQSAGDGAIVVAAVVLLLVLRAILFIYIFIEACGLRPGIILLVEN